MGDMLSQDEIDALLSGALSMDDESDNSVAADDAALTPEEIDALGEIGNISMGTSATTLYTLLGQKVMITTPRVSVTTWEDLSKQYPEPYVAVKVKYTNGLIGDNLLIMKEPDVKVITDLMMDGDGKVEDGSELSELHLSAISEAMNQMVGSAATSLSSMFSKRVDISPPESLLISFAEDIDKVSFEGNKQIVIVAFSLTVGNLIDSSIMQLIPLDFAKEMVMNLTQSNQEKVIEEKPIQAERHENQEQRVVQQQNVVPQQSAPQQSFTPPPQHVDNPDYYQQMPNTNQRVNRQNSVNVRPAEFQSLDSGTLGIEAQNINLLMDVPLQITVELGRTSKKIKEILEFGQGSIIELDKLSGEPVDILVNGKKIAKGEVVVIDESFGVRITDIIHPSKRL